jgi:hypothetical protein
MKIKFGFRNFAQTQIKTGWREYNTLLPLFRNKYGVLGTFDCEVPTLTIDFEIKSYADEYKYILTMLKYI